MYNLSIRKRAAPFSKKLKLVEITDSLKYSITQFTIEMLKVEMNSTFRDIFGDILFLLLKENKEEITNSFISLSNGYFEEIFMFIPKYGEALVKGEDIQVNLQTFKIVKKNKNFGLRNKQKSILRA